MSLQKIPIDSVKKLKRHILAALALPDSEQQSQIWSSSEGFDDVPEPESVDDLSGLFTFGGLPSAEVGTSGLRETWFISTVNPAAALIKLPGLWLKPNFRLVSYLYRSADHGVGVVWAVPEALSSTAQLEKALNSKEPSQPPKPDGALERFMDAIDGDRSPVSFVIASLLRRELQEFGALGKHCNWSHHRFIDAVPTKATWQWRTEQPKDLSPKVKVLPDGQAIVEFFTFRITEPITLFRHLDQYPVGQYSPNSLDKGIAVIKR